VQYSKPRHQLKRKSNPPPSSPSPLFKGGSFREGVNPSLAKRGRGDLCAECNRSYATNFWDRTLAWRGQHGEIYQFLGVEILRQGPFFTQERQVAAHFFQVDGAVGRKNADDGLVGTFRLAWVDSIS